MESCILSGHLLKCQPAGTIPRHYEQKQQRNQGFASVFCKDGAENRQWKVGECVISVSDQTLINSQPRWGDFAPWGHWQCLDTLWMSQLGGVEAATAMERRGRGAVDAPQCTGWVPSEFCSPKGQQPPGRETFLSSKEGDSQLQVANCRLPTQTWNGSDPSSAWGLKSPQNQKGDASCAGSFPDYGEGNFALACSHPTFLQKKVDFCHFTLIFLSTLIF